MHQTLHSGAVLYIKDSQVILQIARISHFGRIRGTNYLIYGNQECAAKAHEGITFDRPAVYLPDISINAILLELSQPSAKHATFNRSGNQFSRIAHLVQVGYHAIGNGTQPQHSGVRFRWTAKDLRAYAQQWKTAVGAQGDAALQGFFRQTVGLDHIQRDMDQIYYWFITDTTAGQCTKAQYLGVQHRLEEEAKVGHQISFD